jgi:catalase-peroxidase
MRGGANGARLRLEPQIHWLANNPAELATVLARLDAMRADFNRRAPGGRQISLADMIVLAGNAGVEQAARAAGADLSLPFKPGRVDATQTQTDAASFAPLEPTADGFRNYYSTVNTRSPAEMLVERATLLELTVPEMTVLVGGMRALNANSGQSADGVLTTRPGVLTNDFFVNLLDMRTQWAKSDRELGKYIGSDRVSGQRKWSATPVDLVFGSNSELRAVAEVYASDDASRKFIDDFGRAWTKVMDLDRR